MRQQTLVVTRISIDQSRFEQVKQNRPRVMPRLYKVLNNLHCQIRKPTRFGTNIATINDPEETFSAIHVLHLTHYEKYLTVTKRVHELIIV